MKLIAFTMLVMTFLLEGAVHAAECVHWADAFYPEAIVDHAKVKRETGERLYLYPRNPELCSTPNDEECAGHAYVISGDQLFVGNMCGKWAYVWFPIPNRPRASGWVERNRIEIVRTDTQGLPKNITQRKLMSGLLLSPTSDVFLLAIRNSDLKQVESMLGSGGSDRMRTECELVAYNALYSDIQTLHTLVKAGLDPNCSSSYHPSPLHRLASVDRGIVSSWIDELPDPVVATKNWIDVGARLDAKDGYGNTPLRLAIKENNTDIAKVLLAAGADPDSYQEELSIGTTSALTEAINYYPLTYDISMIKLLLKHGANVNFSNKSKFGGTSNEECPNLTTGVCEFSGQTVLTGAVEDGYYSVVKLLLDFGANPNLTRLDGKSPLDIALAKKDRRIIKLLKVSFHTSKE